MSAVNDYFSNKWYLKITCINIRLRAKQGGERESYSCKYNCRLKMEIIRLDLLHLKPCKKF